MDILVCIPSDQEQYVRATKLNPISGLTDGYWSLHGHPKFTRAGERIWFSIYGEVVASATIVDPRSNLSDADYVEERVSKPAVCFDVPTVLGHEFSVPRGLSPGFRGFRYVRSTSRHSSIKRIKALELVSAQEVKRIYPRKY